MARSLAQGVHDPRADGQVVVGDVELGRPQLREVLALGRREADGETVDVELDRRCAGDARQHDTRN
jgi:hypothetical protein